MSDCGHGWVHARADGVRARCGGPAVCAKCAQDLKEVLCSGDVLMVCLLCGGRYFACSEALPRVCLCGGALALQASIT